MSNGGCEIFNISLTWDHGHTGRHVGEERQARKYYTIRTYLLIRVVYELR